MRIVIPFTVDVGVAYHISQYPTKMSCSNGGFFAKVTGSLAV